jgi:ATP-binding cassette subfamily F protein uup
MALIVLNNAKLAFGHVDLLANTSFSLEEGERVGLIGRNGTGKSSLLKILAEMDRPDDGLLQKQQNIRIAYVAQEPFFEPGALVFDAVAVGVAEVKALRDEYEEISMQEWTDQTQSRMDELHSQIEARHGWAWEQRVTEALQKLHLDGQRKIEDLSGGTRKRVALAQALVAEPDVLLLDEPTNHLDLDSIQWLEELLQNIKGAIVFITHDRAFLDHVATRIVELDRGILRSYPGNFTAYLGLKEKQLEDEALANARADKLLAQEEVWIRQGVEARRTRSVGRIARLETLRKVRQERRDAVGQVKLDISSGQRSGKIVSVLENVSKSYDGKAIVKDFDATILRGDKVGILGPNGAGKSTLLKLILGKIEPDSGEVKQGSNLEVAYFDQMREGLNLEATLEDFISPGSEWVEISGQRKHVKSYLGDFLFAPERGSSPIKSLSGGERNRLLLARLFAKPANVLVLDEPTNDLDIDTLDLLEDFLQQYSGTVFLVSHDRQFLDNVVTSMIAFEGDGHWREYEGGYEDWKIQNARRLQHLANNANTKPMQAEPLKATQKNAPTPVDVKKSNLSKRQKQELEEIPEKINVLELEQADIGEVLSDPNLYVSNPGLVEQHQKRLLQIEADIQVLMDKWESLSALE